MPRLEDTHLYKGHKAAEKAKEEHRRENYEMAYYYYALALQQYGKSTMYEVQPGERTDKIIEIHDALLVRATEISDLHGPFTEPNPLPPPPY